MVRSALMGDTCQGVQVQALCVLVDANGLFSYSIDTVDFILKNLLTTAKANEH